MNLENGKEFPLSLPTLGLGPFFSPPRPACSPSPLFFPARPSARLRPNTAQPSKPPRLLPLLQPLTGGPALCFTDRWGLAVRIVFYLESEQDTSPSRNHRARFARAVPTPPVSPPLYTRLDPRQASYSILAPAAAKFSPKNNDEIRAEAISPPQRIQASVSSLPSFGSVVRSRRGLLFALYCSVRSPNARRTSFQGRRPPFAVASSSRTSSAPILASGELALSSRATLCFYLVLSRAESLD